MNSCSQSIKLFGPNNQEITNIEEKLENESNDFVKLENENNLIFKEQKKSVTEEQSNSIAEKQIKLIVEDKFIAESNSDTDEYNFIAADISLDKKQADLSLKEKSTEISFCEKQADLSLVEKLTGISLHEKQIDLSLIENLADQSLKEDFYCNEAKLITFSKEESCETSNSFINKTAAQSSTTENKCSNLDLALESGVSIEDTKIVTEQIEPDVKNISLEKNLNASKGIEVEEEEEHPQEIIKESEENVKSYENNCDINLPTESKINFEIPLNSNIVMAEENTLTLEQELCDLKLKLNQMQQLHAAQELELRQKEEVIIKLQSDFQKKEVGYKQENKQLREKLEENSLNKSETEIKELKETIERIKIREQKLSALVSQNPEENYK